MLQWWTRFLQQRRIAKFRRLRELVRWNRRNREAVAEFQALRQPQSDAAFLVEIDARPDWHGWILAVRRTLAQVSGLEPEWVLASDRFAELTALPGWPGLDIVELVMMLEEEVCLRLPDRELEKIPSPDLHRSMTVREFAVTVAAACERVSQAGVKK